MTKLDRELLRQVKLGFVPQPGGQAEPVAGAGPMTAGMVAPMGGAPMDPAMAGGAPMGPAMMGGMPPMPPAGLDPAMAGMVGGGGGMPPEQGGGMTGSSTLTLTVDDLIKLFKVFQKNSGGAPAAPAAPAAAAPSAGGGTDPRLDKIVQLLEAALGQAEGGGFEQQ